MPIEPTRLRPCLKGFDLPRLFIEELGWERHAQTLEAPADSQNFTLTAVAHKRGMVAFVHEGKLPDYPTRRKIEYRVAKTVHEHIIVYADPQKTVQIWQWVRREPGKPTACREHTFHRDQPGDALIQKLQALAVSMEEEEGLTLVDITRRVRAAFDVERVTKRFYDRFKAEHAAFLSFIKGIPDEEMQRWYVSVMLNRLMFVYFIQKKGFLNGDPDYLRNKLAQTKHDGKNRFYSEFLCPLFFEGFAKKAQNRSAATNQLLGKVPYLNGGIFQRHQIEELHGEKIQVADAAFEKIFDFFEDYDWTLDPHRTVKKPGDREEINPDVLGYIFEKYINQKQMGAYYTKEDITGYNSAYTIVPFLFEVARAKCKVAFEGENSVWKLLQADPDRYIYPAVRHGVSWKYIPDHPQKGEPLAKPLPLPVEIAAGINDVSKRTEWNKPAPGEYALPTEIWREVVARRQRYEEVRKKLATGEIADINDFITCNLDIRQFAQDAIENSEPDLLSAIYAALLAITVLDPTCGSGAFLFAALNILYPLYEACLNRMALFIAEWERTGSKAHPNYSKNFKAELARLAAHHNEPYFILKTIIVNNLYGVDIMDEAVEICKLRLFLKLVAQVESADDIEPLPDIDFNIRAGNTLVGYATYDEVKRAVTSQFDFENAMAKIEDKAATLDSAFEMFRRQQTELGGEVTTADKRDLRKRLEALEDELNRYLATDYGVDVKNHAAFDKWLHSHKPFHWFIQFYGILTSGGFDVLIGNPPYVNAAQVRRTYSVQNFATNVCPDIYAACVERSLHIVRRKGRFGMILPISFQFGGDFAPARRVCREKLSQIWVSAFSRNPAALFSAGLGVRNTICLGQAGENSAHLIQSSRLLRWVEEYRPALFQTIEYTSLPVVLERYGWPRLDSAGIGKLFESLALRGWRLDSDCGRGNHSLRFKTTALYYISAFVDDPPSYDKSGSDIDHTKVGALRFTAADTRDSALVVALSKLALLWWASTGDDFDVTGAGLGSTPIRVSALPQTLQLSFRTLAKKLRSEMAKNVIYTKYAGKWMGNYDVKEVRLLTDTADMSLLKALALEHHWDDVELAYSHFMKATGERPGTVREKPGFGRVSDSIQDDDENE